MFSFLGELIGLVACLIQGGCWCLKSAMGTLAPLEVRTLSLVRSVSSCNFAWPASAAHRLAIGPPWDWFARLVGDPVWPTELAMVAIPSHRSLRG